MGLNTATAARCPNHCMSAVAYHLSTILFHSGTKLDNLNWLNKVGICMHPQSIVCFEEIMVENCDSKVQFWKKDTEKKVSCTFTTRDDAKTGLFCYYIAINCLHFVFDHVAFLY